MKWLGLAESMVPSRLALAVYAVSCCTHQHRLWWDDLIHLVLEYLALGVKGVSADHLGRLLVINRQRQPWPPTHTPAHPDGTTRNHTVTPWDSCSPCIFPTTLPSLLLLLPPPPPAPHTHPHGYTPHDNMNAILNIASSTLH